MPHIDEGRLHAYVDGECPEHEREAIERHLAVCEPCRARAEQVRAAIAEASRLLGHLEPDALQPPPWREIEERAAARRRGPESKRRGRRFPGRLAWAASIMVAFGAGWLAHSSGVGPGDPASSLETRLTTSSDRDRAPAESVPEAAVGATAPDAATAEVETAPDAAIPEVETAEVRGSGESDRTAAVRGGDEQERTTAAETTRAPAQTPRITEALESELRRIRGERRVMADESLRERAVPQRQADRAPLLDEETAAAATGQRARWVRVTAEEAAAWLGGSLRRLPDLELLTLEIGPGGALEGSVPGRPIVRIVYTDTQGSEIILTQQRVGPRAAVSADTPPSDAAPSSADAPMPRTARPPSDAPEGRAAEDRHDPAVRVHPSGRRTFGWVDGDYRLALTARAEPDSLRALADRVR